MADMKADITALLRARNTLIWIVTKEEARVKRAVIESAAAAKFEARTWSCAKGSRDAAGKVLDGALADPTAMFRRIEENSDRAVYIMCDLPAWLRDPMTCRVLRDLAMDLQAKEAKFARAIVILSPSADVPPELAGHAHVLEYPLPEREELGRLVDASVGSLSDDVRAIVKGTLDRDAVIDASLGLSHQEAENAYAKSLVSTKPPRIDPAMVATEKKRAIKGKGLEWYDADPFGFDSLEGVGNLKAWLTLRRKAFSPAARAYGLKAPRGVFLAGVPGCGKSLTAKCVASAWGLPLLRCDLGAVKGKYVGESEASLRAVFAMAETVSPCVFWMDEIEKMFAGASGPQGDGGVSSDQLGAFLAWMQERKGSVFVIATANDVSALPPELLRKGRFDEVFFVDLPTSAERGAILKVALRGRPELAEIDLASVARKCDKFTGSEIAAIVPDALFAAFADGERALTTDDLLTAAGAVVPLADTAKEKIKALRDWAAGRARRASEPENIANGSGRALDL